MTIRFPFASRRFEKSPAFQAVSGSDAFVVSDFSSRSPSQLNMKNSLLLRTGPPTVAPYWFRENGAMGLSFGSKKFFESILAFRTNSNTVPWKAFVPDLVLALICATARPNSAPKMPDSTLNSSSASTDGSSM